MKPSETDIRLNALREKLLSSLEEAVAQIPDSHGSSTTVSISGVDEEQTVTTTFNLVDMAKTWAILTECSDTGF